MARLNEVTLDNADGKAKQALEDVNKAFGAVPNIFKGMANSPAAVQAFLAMDRRLAGGSLTEPERHVVYLAVSQANGCDYCLAAHTLLGKNAGLSDEAMLAVRRGNAADPKHAALAAFARAVVDTKGFVSDDALDAFRAAGYNDTAVVEVVAVVAEATFTNLFNHVNGTELDFPAAPPI